MNNIDVVLPRIKQRAKEIGRNVNENFTKDVYSTLQSIIPQYIKIDCNSVDGIFVYDNTINLKLIYVSSCDENKKKISKCLGKCNSTYNNKFKIMNTFCKDYDCQKGGKKTNTKKIKKNKSKLLHKKQKTIHKLIN
jgi:predicted ABC-type ATPase